MYKYIIIGYLCQQILGGREVIAGRLTIGSLLAFVRERKKIPGVGFTTDIMVGFPGETQGDFLATCDAVKEIGFFKVHIFPYSSRQGTKASRFLEMVPREEIRNRVRRLKALADKKAYEVGMRLVGSLEEVLIEGSGYGYTQGYMPARVKGALSRNELVKVRITGMEGDKDKIIFLSEVYEKIDIPRPRFIGEVLAN